VTLYSMGFGITSLLLNAVFFRLLMFMVEVTTKVSCGFAMKVIELPFVPVVGMTIKEKDFDTGTVFDEYVIDDVYWDMPTKTFECPVHFGLGEEIEVSFDKIEPRGWMKI